MMDRWMDDFLLQEAASSRPLMTDKVLNGSKTRNQL